jgi:hypothetical protein
VRRQACHTSELRGGPIFLFILIPSGLPDQAALKWRLVPLLGCIDDLDRPASEAAKQRQPLYFSQTSTQRSKDIRSAR